MRCPACSFENPENAVSCQRCLTPLAAPRTVPQSLSPDIIGQQQQIRAGRLGKGVVVDNKYSIERVIGEGGMGIVYLAHDIHTEQKVVVKALHDFLAGDPTSRERVRSEGKALARIDHPNVVRLNAVVDDGAGLLLIMQFVDGKSLDQVIEERIAQKRPMPIEEIASLFRQMVRGVAAAHLEGLVHRDLKPANVLLRTKDGVAKVTDFGIAKLEDDAKAGRGKTQGIIGSLWYMSPEQVTGQRDLDKRVDIYALGIVLYELCCGKVPFDAPSDYEIMRMHVDKDMPSITARRPDLPPGLDGVIARAAAKSRNDRFQSCEDLLEAFDATLGAPAHFFSGGSLPPVVPGQRSHSPRPPDVAPAGGRGGTVPLPGAVEGAHAEPSRGAATTGAHVFPTNEPGAGAGAEPASMPGHTFNGDAPPKRSGTLGIVAIVLLSLGLAIGLIAKFLIPDDAPKGRGGLVQSGVTQGGTAAATTPATASTTPVKASPLEALVGKWVSDSERHYDAVLSGDTLELRIRDASEHPGQGYADGETRFSLRHDGKTFTVEDKIRPLPPTTATYAPESRGTCQEVWTEVAGEPLRAQFDGKRLSVDLVKFLGEPRFFLVTKGRVTSCRDFKAAKVERIETLLTREGAP